MTPEERNLVTQLFDRLAALESTQRDSEAERLIQDGLRQAPHAPYALVQTALVQDEALKRADARIRELEAQLDGDPGPQQQQQPSGFLDSMRNSIWGNRPRPGSVPSVRPAVDSTSPYRTDAQPMAPMMQQPMGPMTQQPQSSFLGNAAATAAGLIGGSMLLSTIRSMMTSHSGGNTHAAYDQTAGGGNTPWSGGGNDELARRAGLDDIGRSPTRNESSSTYSALDSDAADHDAAESDDDDQDFDDFDDDGGDEQ
jgi:hypothetical protein